MGIFSPLGIPLDITGVEPAREETINVWIVGGTGGFGLIRGVAGVTAGVVFPAVVCAPWEPS